MPYSVVKGWYRMHPEAGDQIQVAQSVLGLETSQKTSQSFLLWPVSSLELRDLGRTNQPPVPSPDTNHNGTREAAQKFLYESAVLG